VLRKSRLNTMRAPVCAAIMAAGPECLDGYGTVSSSLRREEGGALGESVAFHPTLPLPDAYSRVSAFICQGCHTRFNSNIDGLSQQQTISPMDSTEQLNEDISDLHTRIATLKAHRANLSSVLLSQPHLAARLQNSGATIKSMDHADQIVTRQSKRNLENIYRACAGVTAYKVKDPDPHALNDGNILGVSIDVALGGRFVETYHVLLGVQQKDDKKILRIHKHSIPPCMPLQQLSDKWLPTSGKDEENDPEQDLVRFGRLLRKELVSWHLRVNAVEELRREAGLAKSRQDSEPGGSTATGQTLNAFVSDDEASSDVEEADGETGSVRILDIEADAAVRQITVVWSNKRTAVMSITKDGRVERAVCRTRDGARDVVLSKRAIGPISGLVRRLRAQTGE
jgi:central kinetochore subunit Mal2/MCM21